MSDKHTALPQTWHCPCCHFDHREGDSPGAPFVKRWVGKNAKLLAAAEDMADRFEKCLIGNGTDPEFAAIAVSKAREAIKEAEK